MVLEDALDDLMQYIHRNKPVDVRTGQSPRERLSSSVTVHIQVKGLKMSVTGQMLTCAKKLDRTVTSGYSDDKIGTGSE
jgi:hypothetical protein